MQLSNKQEFIRQIARANASDPEGRRILWSGHAITALVDDSLNRIDVERALWNSEVIEEYPPTHRPLPDCLVLAFLPPNKPIHAVIAIDESNDRILVVTVYVPASDRWENDWQTRK